MSLYCRGWITVTLVWRASLPDCLLTRLQSVLNAAARSIVRLRRSDHITDALVSFLWLRAPERINFKLVIIVYQAVHGTALMHPNLLCYVADLSSRKSTLVVHFQSSCRHDSLLSSTAHSLRLDGDHDSTIYLMTFSWLRH